jgi:hypothetical protein
VKKPGINLSNQEQTKELFVNLLSNNSSCLRQAGVQFSTTDGMSWTTIENQKSRIENTIGYSLHAMRVTKESFMVRR